LPAASILLFIQCSANATQVLKGRYWPFSTGGILRAGRRKRRIADIE
jgi:hypothetical protein